LRPILAVVGILAFVGTFIEFILAYVLIRSVEQFTLMVGPKLTVTRTFAQSWGVFAAGAILGAVPTALIYVLLQD
jgi:arabinogalactan oligomer/maltooligosaccharide transport system permease protein